MTELLVPQTFTKTRVVSALDTRYLPAYNGRRAQLLADFIVETKVAGCIEVPAPFITDFNSVPRGLWNIYPPWEYAEAAIPHDWLYGEGELHGVPITKALADQVHKELLQFRGCPFWKWTSMYAALRVGGGKAWDEHRAQDDSAKRQRRALLLGASV